MVARARWSFNYFFYSKKMKRIIFLTCGYMNLLSPKLNGVVGEIEDEFDSIDDANEPDGPFALDFEPLPRRTSR